MKKFLSFRGKITAINDFYTSSNVEQSGCYKLVSVEKVFY